MNRTQVFSTTGILDNVKWTGTENLENYQTEGHCLHSQCRNKFFGVAYNSNFNDCLQNLGDKTIDTSNLVYKKTGKCHFYQLIKYQILQSASYKLYGEQ